MDEGERRRECEPHEFEAGLEALDIDPHVVRARDWPDGLVGLDQPGLYSWWVDEVGAADLSVGLGLPLEAGRIYAGQTGATAWPSGKARLRTLRDRIGGNHLRGSIYGSTFRCTLAASLRNALQLDMVAPMKLAKGGEQAISAWIRDHLSVAVHAFSARDPLEHLPTIR